MGAHKVTGLRTLNRPPVEERFIVQWFRYPSSRDRGRHCYTGVRRNNFQTLGKSSATNPGLVWTLMTAVFVSVDLRVSASILPLLWSGTLPLAGMRVWRRTSYLTVGPPSSGTRGNDSSAICSGHPAATCVPLMVASKRQQDNAWSHIQGGHRKPPQHSHTSCLVARFIVNRTSMGPQFQQPMSLHVLEALLQQMWSDVQQNRIQNLYTSMPARITSCTQARGSTTGTRASMLARITSCIQARGGTTGY
ncbi:hypothetical protein GDO78_003173 [Eleutherodactylus coqui]|uniref:Uncharacterized protein n=1 Tax=Eleutherodactylus coqui TaxID=57060 RepID=A0A8J6EW26_ELECQ|nr:hypothetical protein GDO78_003173 [Eleutherodactylus coqui]